MNILEVEDLLLLISDFLDFEDKIKYFFALQGKESLNSKLINKIKQEYKSIYNIFRIKVNGYILYPDVYDQEHYFKRLISPDKSCDHLFYDHEYSRFLDSNCYHCRTLRIIGYPTLSTRRLSIFYLAFLMNMTKDISNLLKKKKNKYADPLYLGMEYFLKKKQIDYSFLSN